MPALKTSNQTLPRLCGQELTGNLDRMFELAATQPGFLGVESARDAKGFGITVSYWSSEEAIAAWKAHAEHKSAQGAGKRIWYANYQVRIAKVERAYGKKQSV